MGRVYKVKSSQRVYKDIFTLADCSISALQSAVAGNDAKKLKTTSAMDKVNNAFQSILMKFSLLRNVERNQTNKSNPFN